jgi:hypothetical protein
MEQFHSKFVILKIQMMKIFLLFLLLVVFNEFSAQTTVSGGIYQNTTWTLAGSPYIVNGSIVVFPGNTLNVEPGVTVLINNSTNNNIYIETRGTLNLVGTDQLPINVRCQYDTTSIGWQGFKCTSSQGGALNADRFRIANAEIPFQYEAPPSLYEYTNCRFSYCGQAVTVGNETILNNCQFIGNTNAVYGWTYFTINNCYFQENNTAINAYSTSFNLTNSNFSDNNTALLFSAGVFDTMIVQNCNFQNNELAIGFPSNGVIENCVFTDNTVGVQGSYVCEIRNNIFNYNELALNVSILTKVTQNQINQNIGGVRISDIGNVSNSPIITNNEICSNINFNVDNNTNVNYSLLTNCFCGLDSAQIETYLIDGYDDITKGLINYQVYDSSCVNVLSTVSKFGALSSIQSLELDLKFTNPFDSQLKVVSSINIEAIVLVDSNGKLYNLESLGNNVFDTSILNPGVFVLRFANEILVNQKLIKI